MPRVERPNFWVQMIPQFALLLDGGFVIQKLQARLRRFPSADDVEAECDRLRDHPTFKDYELLRIYFYHAPPSDKKVVHPISQEEIFLGRTRIHQDSQQLLDALEQRQDFALRLGETAVQGWKLRDRAQRSILKNPRHIEANDIVVDVQQKGVDLRIGLDIARLALRDMARAIVVVSGDSDLIPSFRFARREGLRIYLDCMGHGVWPQLKAHADQVI